LWYNGVTASGRAAGRFKMLNTGQNAKNKLTVLYARLSKEDEQLGTSGSIANQLKLLEDYAYTNGFSPTIRLSDDGYTGTNFVGVR
jgi:hypothetical protein